MVQVHLLERKDAYERCNIIIVQTHAGCPTDAYISDVGWVVYEHAKLPTIYQSYESNSWYILQPISPFSINHCNFMHVPTSMATDVQFFLWYIGVELNTLGLLLTYIYQNF